MSNHPVSLTAEQIAEIQARLDARTPGEWLHDTACPFGFVAKCGDSSEASHYVVPRDLDWIPDGAKHDAEFIAHAPQDIADLLADRSARGEEVERLRARVEELEADKTKLRAAAIAVVNEWDASAVGEGVHAYTQFARLRSVLDGMSVATLATLTDPHS